MTLLVSGEREELATAFVRSPVDVPWWRVYQVLRSDATVVFRGERLGPHTRWPR
jgi:hypothetical protein